MSNSNLWQEKLIALLYGELNSADERDVRLRLETDSDLRREWEELQEGREWLGALETEVEIPQFAFLHDSGEAHPQQGVIAPVAPVAAKPWWNWGSPLWGAAAAVFLIGVLGLSGFRVQSVDGGLAFTFGNQPRQEETLANSDTPRSGIDLVATNTRGSVKTGGVELTPVSNPVGQPTSQYSRDELLYMVGAMIENRDRRRDQELAAILQAMYEDVGARQDKDYQDLKDQIQTMNVGRYLDRQGFESRFNNLEGVQSLDIAPGEPVDGQKEN